MIKPVIIILLILLTSCSGNPANQDTLQIAKNKIIEAGKDPNQYYFEIVSDSNYHIVRGKKSFEKGGEVIVKIDRKSKIVKGITFYK
jgi:hypothetical protein